MFITGDCHKYYECYGTLGLHECPDNQGYTFLIVLYMINFKICFLYFLSKTEFGKDLRDCLNTFYIDQCNFFNYAMNS